MAKMNKDEIKIRFAELSDTANDQNKKIKNKLGRERFIPMRQERHGKLQEFGLYDYVTKRYTLGNIHAGNAQKILNEMKAMLAVQVDIDSLFEKIKS